MSNRLEVLKTYKLFIAGAFPRSESGRSDVIKAADGRVVGHSCRASRKDLRDSVAAARKALPGWSNATPYLRAQILYRMAEMLEGKRAEFAELLAATDAGPLAPERQITLAVDRLVAFAGWADKFTHVLGCQNAVSAPYWNITVPEPTGVIGVVCPTDHALLALVSLVAPVICSGNTAAAISPASPAVVCVFGEVCATSDLPGGVVNLLTGSTDELIPFLAQHRDVDGVHAVSGGAGVTAAQEKILRLGVADNLKRVAIHRNVDWTAADACQSPWWIEPFVESKTVWHPVGA